MIFTCATDDFQKYRKNAIFENCITNISFEKNQMFDVLRWLDQSVAACILVWENILLKKHLFSKTLFFAFFTKNRGI